MSGRFPWSEMMFAGLGLMRLSPRDFWAASPREIAAAFPAAGRAPLGRDEMDRLMQRFPDAT